MTAPRPSARRAAGSVIRDGEFWLYGGFGARGTVAPDDVGADIWRHGRAGWSLVTEDAGPGARYPSLIDLDGTLWRFGGCGWTGEHITFEDRVWRFSGSKEWLEAGDADPRLPRPPGRYVAAIAPIAQGFCIFGGHSQSLAGEKFFHNDLWLFRDGAWIECSCPLPRPSPSYGFGWCVDGGSLYVFGGYDGSADLDDFWRLDLTSLAADHADWEALPKAPHARFCPALGATEKGIVLFGGRSKTQSRMNYADTWIFDPLRKQWVEYSGPSPVYHAKPAYASDGRMMMLFGGEGPTGHLSDLWRFDADGWRMLQPPSPDDPVFW